MSFSGSVYEISTDAEYANDGSIRVILHFRNAEHYLSLEQAKAMNALLESAIGKAEYLAAIGKAVGLASPPNGARDHSRSSFE